ncbi:hypothetical protein LTR36_002737 [Oleoguttula mirabilis]|uniref:Large ribosomal subunit protein mL54 n=1 Tax=Oleoguttula mirabilis TaxID=1507867 RepID=A0AAV9JKR7_9PEZI|nr:hypothetical protein LTR36_002737 [Oleoguttula mirabilis]
MICQRCLRRLAHRNAASSPSHRAAFSRSARQSSTPVSAQTTTATNPRPHDAPAATTTPGVAQPFSTPLSPKPSRQHTKAAAKLPQSSVPAGTVLKGLNFMKNKPDPVALEDSEYPDWLWGVLAKGEEAGDSGVPSEGDLFAKSKKQRQIAAKALRKQQLLNPDALAPKIPLYEQSIDLPSGDGSLRGAIEAVEAREELTKSMRDSRRKGIKEANFLKTMR